MFEYEERDRERKGERLDSNRLREDWLKERAFENENGGKKEGKRKQRSAPRGKKEAKKQ